MTPQTLAALLDAQSANRSVVLATRLQDGSQAIWPGGTLPAGVAEAAGAALARDRSETLDLAGERWFLQVQSPAWRLVIAGAVHIAQALVPLAAAVGMAATVIDPRAPFNSAERFPGATRLLAWPDAAMAGLALGPQTAIVALAHDPKLDDPALDAALHAGAFFVGALGSRKSHAARLLRLAALGHGPDALARIRGPVGLALGAVSAAEIALSIMAEIVAVRRGAALGQRP